MAFLWLYMIIAKEIWHRRRPIEQNNSHQNNFNKSMLSMDQPKHQLQNNNTNVIGPAQYENGNLNNKKIFFDFMQEYTSKLFFLFF